jgi:hypothetical protein
MDIVPRQNIDFHIFLNVYMKNDNKYKKEKLFQN